ncbi:hypothetical protein [Thermoactinospora rubra]|uniref:hypothetical protein n=1 Tax=Thermoactinospora rubra TaxID=1088767 RepID=UPI000A0FFC4B|nr:hypothetical protein [Thermoactinospora rubra]
MQVLYDTATPADEPAPVASAVRLRLALRELGIEADVHDGYGLALVSVWVGLVVWCDGDRFWWRASWDDRRKRTVYAWHPAHDPERAAQRIAFRYRDLRATHDKSTAVEDGDR